MFCAKIVSHRVDYCTCPQKTGMKCKKYKACGYLSANFKDNSMKRRELPDMELVRLLQGDEKMRREALAYIMAHWQEDTIQMICKNSGSRQDGEDIFSEALYKFDMNVRNGHYQNKGALKAYFKRIAYNKWMDKLKDRKKMPFTDLPSDNHPEKEGENMAMLRADALLHDPVFTSELRVYFDALGKYCYDIEILTSEGLSQEEIAEKLGMNGGADQVKKEKNRCKNRKEQETERFTWLKNYIKNF
jgi:RNA polymerase sigma factor (sigma-70 family)